MSRLVRIVLLAAVVSGLAAALAFADQTISAAPGGASTGFVGGGSVTMAQGEKVTFQNSDLVAHDVTATTKGADGKPLFRSELIGSGQSADVVGTEYLTTGSYGFICSVHPNMTGTLTVTSAGTPVPRPGSGGGGGTTAPPSSDTTAPDVAVKVLDTKRGTVRKRRSLQLSITASEAVTLKLTATSGSTTVASGKAELAKTGTKKVSIKLTKAGLAAVKRAKPLRISVKASAKDAAGNVSTASASGRLR
jgi:plastocyanin